MGIKVIQGQHVKCDKDIQGEANGLKIVFMTKCEKHLKLNGFQSYARTKRLQVEGKISKLRQSAMKMEAECVPKCGQTERQVSWASVAFTR